jgi:hypothetical protein
MALRDELDTEGYGTVDLVAFARATLSRWSRPAAQPAPDHANLIGFAFGREPWATWLRQGGCLESAHCELSDLMLAVLARWGRPTTPPAPEVGEFELTPREVEAQEAFTQLRDEVLNLLDGVEVNEVLGIIDNHTPEWV